MIARTLALLAALVAASCATLPGVELPARGTAEVCVPLYKDFDRLERFYGSGNMWGKDLIASPELMERGMDLLRADCITRLDDLTIEAAPRSLVRESGVPIDPIALHAGVVAGITGELRVRDYFADRGIRVRSVGHIALGRRIYLGPFSTDGGRRAAAQAAREAGFVAPYPAFF